MQNPSLFEAVFHVTMTICPPDGPENSMKLKPGSGQLIFKDHVIKWVLSYKTCIQAVSFLYL